MAANYVLLEKITVGAAGASSVTFSGIPQTGYTDLLIKVSARDTTDNLPVTVSFNGSAIDSGKTIKGNGSGAFSGSETVFWITPSSATGSTFGSAELYIPNYTGSTAKSMSIDAVTENNGATAYTFLSADLENGTSAITSMGLAATTSFTQYSTFYLYGVAKLGTTPAIVPYATGGDTIMTDGTYWYHTFVSSGTFTPQKSLSCDYLVVAGAGGAGGWEGGGGGAGGLRSTVTATGGGGSLESVLTLNAATNYTVTIGAGGAGAVGGSSVVSAVNGSSSIFSTITSSGGGSGADFGSSGGITGGNGGSGGGGSFDNAGLFQFGPGTGTVNQGYAGGTGTATSNFNGGGGGGAGVVGTNATTSVGGTGAGGNGVAVSITGSSVTYAGGGGGGAVASGSGGAGGSGGGGAGGAGGASNSGTAGTANTGGGGGGAGATSTTGTTAGSGGNGGSGVVIVRYAV